MDGLKYYNIPIKTADLGLHEYTFEVDDEFFLHFENSFVDNGEFVVKIHLDKRVTLIEVNFIIYGNFKTPCDRCLAEIPIEINTSKRMLFKYDESGKEDEEEVMYITPDDSDINIAGLIYEFISLSIPISKTIDCEENDFQFCDEKVLEYYDLLEEEAEKAAEEDKEERSNIWDALNDIKLN